MKRWDKPDLCLECACRSTITIGRRCNIDCFNKNQYLADLTAVDTLDSTTELWSQILPEKDTEAK